LERTCPSRSRFSFAVIAFSDTMFSRVSTNASLSHAYKASSKLRYSSAVKAAKQAFFR